MEDKTEIPQVIKDTCDLFDCYMISTLEVDDKTNNIYGVYYLGDKGDSSVGINSFALTPYFKTIGELADYCKSIDGKAQINEEMGIIFPTDWDTDNMEWR